MNTVIVALLMALTPIASKAEAVATRGDYVSVAGNGILIPRPAGFVTISSKTRPFKSRAEFLTRLSEHPSIELLALAPEAEAPLILNGELQQSTKMLTVDVPRHAMHRLTSRSELLKHKLWLKFLAENNGGELNDEKSRAEINKVLKEQNSGLTFQSVVLLPPHHETDRSISSSGYAKFTQNDEQGNSVSTTMVATTTFLHLRSELLLLSVHADESELEWTRQISKQWTEAVIEANPPDLRTIVRDSLYDVLPHLDWLKIFGTALLAILVVGGTRAVYRLTRRTKPLEQSNYSSTPDDASPLHDSSTR